ncbi:MAG: transglycosylase domain-containing protein, partial [Pseudomonadota bacterium]
MARKKPGKGKAERIEPVFDTEEKPSGSFLDLGLSDDDRTAATTPGARKTKASGRKKASAPKARRRSGGGKRKKPRSSSGLVRFIRRSVYWGTVLGLWAVIGVVGILTYYTLTLPSSTTWQIPDRPPNVRIVAVDGSLIANRGATGGEAVPLSEMPVYLSEAIIAIEDRRFYSHFGFDIVGFSRAMLANLEAGRLIQGGSSITQQLAKNLFLKPERTIERKIQELILALWLEAELTKDEILQLYLNRVYFGAGAYGVDAAARTYFKKSARHVNLGEAAILAGLVKAPSRLAPNKNPEGAQARAKLVLAAMEREGFITPRERELALT